jgi:hypothetical protein
LSHDSHQIGNEERILQFFVLLAQSEVMLILVNVSTIMLVIHSQHGNAGRYCMGHFKCQQGRASFDPLQGTKSLSDQQQNLQAW